jgi:hypothetical protein
LNWVSILPPVALNPRSMMRRKPSGIASVADAAVNRASAAAVSRPG